MSNPSQTAASRPPCACGSGLAGDRCCALDWARAWPAADPAALDAARSALTRGDAAAEPLLLRTLDRSPNDLGALTLLYELNARRDRPAAAEALLGRIVRLDPNHAPATIALAALLFRRNQAEAAERHARNAVRLAPDHLMAHTLMGMILTDGHRPQAGEHHYRQALALTKRPTAALLASLAWNLKTQGRMAEGRGFYEQSLALDPKAFNALYGWAQLEEADRRLDRAAELLDASEHLAPGHPYVALQRAVLLRRRGAPGEALALLDDLQQRIAAAPADPGLRLDILKARGALLDQLGRHPEAFAAYEEASQAMREATGQTYLAEDAQALARRLKAFFTTDRVRRLPRADTRTDLAQPVFIVGFPRSGTTLVEQMLSAHPLISAGDELPVITHSTEALPRLLDSPLPYPEALADLWLGDRALGLDLLRDDYLNRARQLGAMGEGARWFTDKMPLNETHLGLIGLVFPKAPILHILRHPLDVVLSVFFNPMTHGFHCATDLASIARHYVLVMDLVDHYRRHAPQPYLAVRYEDIIGAQEAKLREILAFVGAPYDPACLDFHENRRYARTASYAQVTEALHSRSRFRYRAYRDELEPVIPMLAPLIRRLGYAVD
jgi:tetratricopeptide (TPR) repeat protein